jgi:hypothetical protein
MPLGGGEISQHTRAGMEAVAMAQPHLFAIQRRRNGATQNMRERGPARQIDMVTRVHVDDPHLQTRLVDARRNLGVAPVSIPGEESSTRYRQLPEWWRGTGWNAPPPTPEAHAWTSLTGPPVATG